MIGTADMFPFSENVSYVTASSSSQNLPQNGFDSWLLSFLVGCLTKIDRDRSRKLVRSQQQEARQSVSHEASEPEASTTSWLAGGELASWGLQNGSRSEKREPSLSQLPIARSSNQILHIV